ncbi:MAG: sugar-transfer associated ATP-grasp domain-containing protein [Microgenomates group bacterium]
MGVKPSHILGMNARHYYTRMNSSKAKSYGFSKLKTKELMLSAGNPTASLYHIFSSRKELDTIHWESIPVPFVIKPVNGLAGKGIWIITKKMTDESSWRNNFNDEITKEDLDLHVQNILDGEYSTWGRNHRCLVEEMIPVHPSLAKYTYKGTPDIRVIVFNSVPVMAMARIPTEESEGKANLDQGAIGLGIDIASGVTTYGIQGKSGYITHFPHIKKKVNGIIIPEWQRVLEVAVKAAEAAGYKYMGADIFIHPEKGPMIVELNGYPGLSIQLANKAGLKRRLERVEGLEVRDAKHGVKIARALFAESFADKIKVEEGIQIISTQPTVKVVGDDATRHSTEALVNTGRYRSAISSQFAESLGLLDLEDLLWRQQESIEGKVPVVEVAFILKGTMIKTAMVVTKRLNRTKHKIELGRKDIQGFLIGETEE